MYFSELKIYTDRSFYNIENLNFNDEKSMMESGSKSETVDL